MYLSTKVSQKETLACQNNGCEHFIILTGYLTNFFIPEFIYLVLEAVKLPADWNSSPSGMKYKPCFNKQDKTQQWAAWNKINNIQDKCLLWS